MIATFLALYWPELTGLAVIVTASLWLNWALSGDVTSELIVGIPAGCGTGALVAAWRAR